MFASQKRGMKVLCLIKSGNIIYRVRGRLTPSTTESYEIRYKFHGYIHKAIAPVAETFMLLDDWPTFGIIFGELTARPLFSTTNTSETLVSDFLNSQVIRQAVEAVKSKKPFELKGLLIVGAVIAVIIMGIYGYNKIKSSKTPVDPNPPITTTIDTYTGPPPTSAITLPP